MAKVTHGDLLRLAKRLNYLLSSEGLCKGFSGILAQTILAEDEEEALEQFFQRLDWIAQYKEKDGNFDRLVRDIENAKEKRKNFAQIKATLEATGADAHELEEFEERKKQLDEKTKDPLEVLGFFETITQYQIPNQELFPNEYIDQTKMGTIFSLARSKDQERVDQKIFVFNRSCAFELTDLENYLSNLETFLSQFPSSIPIELGSSDHSVLCKYDKSKKKWFFVDTTDFQSKEQSYVRYLDSKDLAKAIFSSFENNPEYSASVFNASFITKDPTFEKKFKEFNVNYPITEKEITLFDNQGIGLLYTACKNGDLDTVKKLIVLNNISNQINKPRNNGTTPLFIACQHGHVEIVKLLLASMGDKMSPSEINTPRNDGATPFVMACQEGHVKIVETLLTKLSSSEINQIDENGNTPFHKACIMGQLEIVNAILAAEGNKLPANEIYRPNNDGITPLHVACHNGNLDLFKALLTKIPPNEINKPVGNGITPLYLACQNGNLDLVKALLTKIPSSEINKPIDNGATPFIVACVNGHNNVIKECLNQMTFKEMSKPGLEGFKPLQVADEPEFNDPEIIAIIKEKEKSYFQQSKEFVYYKRGVNPKQWKQNEATTTNPLYGHLKGDRLKAQVLIDFKESLVGIKNENDLKDKISDFKNNGGYDILKIKQGKIGPFFQNKSISAYQKIVKEAREEIRKAEKIPTFKTGSP